MDLEIPRSSDDVRINRIDVLSDAWYTLRRVDFDYRIADGNWQNQQREAYDRGNGATILLIDWSRETIILTRQFRMPAFLNGHVDGMLIEAPAGLLDADDAETAIRREAEEETGYRVRSIERLFELFMSPGSVTERVAFFAAEYTPEDRVSAGGGLEHEAENIEVLELDLDAALEMVRNGEVNDGKTVILLQWAQRRRDERESTAC